MHMDNPAEEKSPLEGDPYFQERDWWSDDDDASAIRGLVVSLMLSATAGIIVWMGVLIAHHL